MHKFESPVCWVHIRNYGSIVRLGRGRNETRPRFARHIDNLDGIGKNPAPAKRQDWLWFARRSERTFHCLTQSNVKEDVRCRTALAVIIRNLTASAVVLAPK
jgi:hypothetical protein